MNWIVKKYDELTIDELYNILKARFSVFVLEQHCFYPEIDDKDQTAYHFFQEQNGMIIAYLRILPRGTSFKELAFGRVMVKKEYRGKGIAKELIASAIDFIQKELNETTIQIQAQVYLREFYNSFGFEPVSAIYLEDDIPHIDMVLNLEC